MSDHGPCSFCGKGYPRESFDLIVGPGVNICAPCVDICNDLLARQPEVGDLTVTLEHCDSNLTPIPIPPPE